MRSFTAATKVTRTENQRMWRSSSIEIIQVPIWRAVAKTHEPISLGSLLSLIIFHYPKVVIFLSAAAFTSVFNYLSLSQSCYLSSCWCDHFFLNYLPLSQSCYLSFCGWAGDLLSIDNVGIIVICGTDRITRDSIQHPLVPTIPHLHIYIKLTKKWPNMWRILRRFFFAPCEISRILRICEVMLGAGRWATA